MNIKRFSYKSHMNFALFYRSRFRWLDNAMNSLVEPRNHRIGLFPLRCSNVEFIRWQLKTPRLKSVATPEPRWSHPIGKIYTTLKTNRHFHIRGYSQFSALFSLLLWINVKWFCSILSGNGHPSVKWIWFNRGKHMNLPNGLRVEFVGCKRRFQELR